MYFIQHKFNLFTIKSVVYGTRHDNIHKGTDALVTHNNNFFNIKSLFHFIKNRTFLPIGISVLLHKMLLKCLHIFILYLEIKYNIIFMFTQKFNIFVQLNYVLRLKMLRPAYFYICLISYYQHNLVSFNKWHKILPNK